MNKDELNRAWGLSLLVIGVSTLILAAQAILAFPLPDWIVRILGIADLLALPVLAFTSIRKLRNL